MNYTFYTMYMQLSGDSTSQATHTTSDPALEEELTKVRSEMAQLKSRFQQVTSERDQANSDLSALRDAMMQQQEESTSKVNTIGKGSSQTAVDNDLYLFSLVGRCTNKAC